MFSSNNKYDDYSITLIYITFLEISLSANLIYIAIKVYESMWMYIEVES